MGGVAAGDVLGDGEVAAHTAPAQATKENARTERKPREFMAGNVQTYGLASTAKAMELINRNRPVTTRGTDSVGKQLEILRLGSAPDNRVEQSYSRPGAPIVTDAARK